MATFLQIEVRQTHFIMVYTYVRPIFDRRKNVDKKGKGMVEVFIQLTRSVKKYISLTTITPEEWEEFKDSKELHAKLDYYEKIAEAMFTLGEEITKENLDLRLGIKPKEDPYDKKGTDSFEDFMRDTIAEEHLSTSTMKKKEVVMSTIESFGRLKTFNDITLRNIILFEDYLSKPYGSDGNGQPLYRKTTSKANYHKTLHKYTHKAMLLGYITRDPYDEYHFDRGSNAEKSPLTKEEIDAIENYPLKKKKQMIARDLFIFAAYTGLSYCDMMSFDFGKQTEFKDGMYYIISSREKTGVNYHVPILPPAMRVLKRYGNKLPRISNQKGNDYLHIIEDEIGIMKPLTFHIGRHSFATLMLSLQVPLDRVSKMMGHSTTKHTARYAKTMPSTIHEEGNRLAGLIK